MNAALSRLNLPLAILGSAIVLGLAYDGAVLINHVRPAANQASEQKSEKKEQADKSKATKPAKQHPCNHGYYVSQAAHAKKGADYVKQIAQSDLGKDGDCSKPLPAPNSSPKPSPTSEQD